MEDLNLYDDKEFFLQPVQSDKYIPYSPAIDNPKKAINVLIREWNGEKWGFGPITEVQVPKNMKGTDFAKYIQEKCFPHIALD